MGLLVDFLVHVLLRFHESTYRTRHARVVDTLETMGSSILLGGLSTFLGVLPLALSTSALFRTVFICWCSMITLGISHGLMLLPVLLSMLGPMGKRGSCTQDLSADECQVNLGKNKVVRRRTSSATLSTKASFDEGSLQPYRTDSVSSAGSENVGIRSIGSTNVLKRHTGDAILEMLDESCSREGDFGDNLSEFSCTSIHV